MLNLFGLQSRQTIEKLGAYYLNQQINQSFRVEFPTKFLEIFIITYLRHYHWLI